MRSNLSTIFINKTNHYYSIKPKIPKRNIFFSASFFDLSFNRIFSSNNTALYRIKENESIINKTGDKALLCKIKKSKSVQNIFNNKTQQCKIKQNACIQKIFINTIHTDEKVNASCNDVPSPFLSAIHKRDLELVKNLLKAKVDVNEADAEGRTPLMLACENIDLEMSKLLIKGGAEVHSVDNRGNNLLMYAFKDGFHLGKMSESKNESFFSFIKYLIKFTKNDQANEEGNTPLMIASASGHVKIVNLLLKANANENIENKFGLSAFSIACDRVKELKEFDQDYCKIIELLKNAKNNNPETYKQYSGLTNLFKIDDAVMTNDLEKAKQLIKNGWNINQKDFNQNTMLMKAVVKGSVKMVKLLVDANANTQMKNCFGKTALCIALHKHQRNQKWLKRFSKIFSLFRENRFIRFSRTFLERGV